MKDAKYLKKKLLKDEIKNIQTNVAIDQGSQLFTLYKFLDNNTSAFDNKSLQKLNKNKIAV